MPRYPKDRKFWYYDSLVIAAGEKIIFKTIETENSETTTVDVVVNKYTFIDLRKKWLYEYTTFSDTSKIIAKYQPDSSGKVNGGWNFFLKQYAFNYDNLVHIPDTTIDGILYQRIKSSAVSNDSSKIKYVEIGFIRCDLKRWPFRVDPPLSAKLGCPLVRQDDYDSNGQGSKIEWKYMSEKLTSAELKVFEVWRKNEEEFPVTR